MTSRLFRHSGLRTKVGGAIAAVVVAAGVSGCQLASPITTDLSYDPGDGVSATVGSVIVRDLLVVSEGNGSPGVIAGLAVNNSNEPVDVTVQVLDTGAPNPPVGSELPAGGYPRPEPLTEQDVAAANEANAAFSLTREIEANRFTRLDGGQAPVPGQEQVPAVVASPGHLATLQITTSAGEVESVRVPVVIPCRGYAELIEPQFPEACGGSTNAEADGSH